MATDNSSDIPTGTSGTVLQGQGTGTALALSTATYPSTATSAGTLLRADGTNWSVTTTTYPSTNAINTLLFASAANVMSALSTANNGTLVTSSTGVPSILAGPGTTGNVFQSNAAAAPSFSTATFPSTATSVGTILRADGTNWSVTTTTYPNTNAVNTLLYASSANVMSALATANNGTLITSGGGVPSISSTLPSAVQGNITAVGTLASGTIPTTLVKGSTSGSAPSAGFIGEVISNSAASQSLSNGVAANITTINLTAGIWDITGYVFISTSGITTTLIGGISATSATLGGLAGINETYIAAPSAAQALSFAVPITRATLSSTTTYYLVGSVSFSTGTASSNGFISATRVG